MVSWAARTLPVGTRVAAVFPDGPHRYLETVYNDAWCRGHHLLDHTPPTEPDEIAEQDEREVDRWTRCTRVRDPLGRDRGASADGRTEAGVR